MSKGYYEQSCEDFALYSSPAQEAYEDEASWSDYYQEAYGNEAKAMAEQAEIEMIIDYINSDEFVGPREEIWS